jgi:hypothetical protein
VKFEVLDLCLRQIAEGSEVDVERLALLVAGRTGELRPFIDSRLLETESLLE